MICNAELCPNYFSVNVSVLAVVFRQQFSNQLTISGKIVACVKLDVQVQGGGRILDINGQGGLGVLKTGQFSWTPYVYHP